MPLPTKTPMWSSRQMGEGQSSARTVEKRNIPRPNVGLKEVTKKDNFPTGSKPEEIREL